MYFSPLLELANYHVLGRIFYYVPYFAPLPPSKVLSTFGGLMALVETLNALGVALSANATSTHQGLGRNLILAALSLQIVVICIFIVIAAVFHSRCANWKMQADSVSTLLKTLYASMALILVRCIYRLVEHSGNTTLELDKTHSLRKITPILRYEWFFYVFEASLMLVNSVLWNIWNPGRFLPHDYHVYLSRDGSTEIKGADVPDKRSLVEKLASILSFGILFRQKHGSRTFEELQEYPAENHQT